MRVASMEELTLTKFLICSLGAVDLVRAALAPDKGKE